MKISLSTKNKTIRNGVIFAFFAILNNGLNFLLIFVLSIYLTKSDFGTLNLFNTFILFISSFITLGTQSYFSVSYFKNSEKELFRKVNVILSLSIFFFVLLFISVLFFGEFFSGVLSFSTTYQLMGLTFCFFQVFYNINLELFRMEEKPFKYGLLTVAWVFSNFLLTYYLCITLNRAWMGRVEAQVIISLLFFLLGIIILKRKGYINKLRPLLSDFKESLSFGLPLIPHSSTVWLRQGLDRYFINFFHSSAHVGTFSFAYNFAGIIMMIGTAFNATNSVFIYKNIENNNNLKEVKKVLLTQTKLMTLLFLIITALVIISIYFFITLFFQKYNDAIPLLLPLCLMGFFQCVYYLFVNYLFYFNKTKKLMYITFLVSLLHVILSFLFTKISIIITAYIGCFTGALICLLVIYQSNKIYPLFKKD